MTLRFCPRCGTSRPEGARFCPMCRVDLVALEAEAEADDAAVETRARPALAFEAPPGPNAAPARPAPGTTPRPSATLPLREATEVLRGLLVARTDAVAIALAVVAVGGVAWALLDVLRLPVLAVVLLGPALAGLAIALFRVEAAVPMIARLDHAVGRRVAVPRTGLIGRFGVRPFLALLALIGSITASFGTGAVAAGLRFAGYSLATVGIGAIVTYAAILIVGLIIAVVVLAVVLWLVLAFLGVNVPRPPVSRIPRPGLTGDGGLESLLPPMITGRSGTIPTSPGFPTFGEPRDAVPLVAQVVAVIDEDGYLREPGLGGAPLGRLHPDGRVEGPGIFGPTTHIVGDDGRIYAVDGILRQPTGFRLAPDGRILETGIVDIETGLRMERPE